MTFARRCLIDLIQNPQVRVKIHDMAGGIGEFDAVRIIQRALNDLHARLKVDGVFGLATLAAVNQADPWELMMELRAGSLGYYHLLVEGNPAKYAAQWEELKARAQA